MLKPTLFTSLLFCYVILLKIKIRSIFDRIYTKKVKLCLYCSHSFERFKLYIMCSIPAATYIVIGEQHISIVYVKTPGIHRVLPLSPRSLGHRHWMLSICVPTIEIITAQSCEVMKLWSYQVRCNVSLHGLQKWIKVLSLICSGQAYVQLSFLSRPQFMVRWVILVHETGALRNVIESQLILWILSHKNTLGNF